MATIQYKTGHIAVTRTPTFRPTRRLFRKSFIISDAGSWFVQDFSPGLSICSILADDMLMDGEIAKH